MTRLYVALFSLKKKTVFYSEPNLSQKGRTQIKNNIFCFDIPEVRCYRITGSESRNFAKTSKQQFQKSNHTDRKVIVWDRLETVHLKIYSAG